MIEFHSVLPDNRMIKRQIVETAKKKEKILKSKQLNIFKIILFIFGFAVIVAAFFIVNHPLTEDGLLSNQKFFWINLCIIYFVFFCPFFFSSISTKNIDSKITPIAGIWISVLLFDIVAIVFSILVLNEILKINFAVIIELVLVFICGIFIYFGYFSGNHIANVQAIEQNSLSKITDVKNAFEMLNLKAETWNDDFVEQKSKVKKLCDDVKYLSPVDTDNAAKLEQKLIIAANVLAESNFLPKEVEQKIDEIELFIKQRKLLRK